MKFHSFIFLFLGLLVWSCNNKSTMPGETVSPKSNYPEPPGRIEFIGDAGSPNTFVIRDWRFLETELPEGKVENIRLRAELNMVSISTEWKKLENSIRNKTDYFYATKFPKATVSIQGAERIEGNRYETDAELTLKDITKIVELTFTVDGKHVVGSGTIKRQDFAFTGSGPKDMVPISFDLYLPE